MTPPLAASDLRGLAEAGDREALRALTASTHPATMADLVAGLEPDDRRTVLLALEPRARAATFGHLEPHVQVAVAVALRRDELAAIVSIMSPDERVDFIERLAPEVREALLPALAQAAREDIRRLSVHEPRTAGAVMSSDYATVGAEQTVAEALETLRLEAPDKETIYYAYVVDPQRRLIGFVSLKDLILAPPSRLVAEVMQREVVRARVDEDQEEVARKIEKFDLIALPVVDHDGVMVGIVTHDDAIDIIRQEQTEDLEKLMAIAGPHEGRYLVVPAFTHFRNRVYWVVSLAVLGLVSGVIVHTYEATIQHLVILALYLPMLADTGGNTGSQSATVIVRALALGQVTPQDVLRIVFKELRIALMLAGILALLAFGKVMWLSAGADLPGGLTLPGIAAAIATALGIQVVTATLLGSLLPLGAARAGFDPAIVASPALTTLVDITGLLIYFTVTTRMLGL